MNAKQIVGEVKSWLITANVLLALVGVLVVLLKQFGVSVPLSRIPDHITLAYAAGVLWLTR